MARPQLRELRIRWVIHTSAGPASLEFGIKPDELLCEASVKHGDVPPRPVDLKSASTCNVEYDPSSDLLHVDIPHVLRTSVQPGRGDSPARLLYARVMLPESFGPRQIISTASIMELDLIL